MSNIISRILSFFRNEKKDIDLSIAVYTTKHVIRENSVILHVYHDMDGDWQFLGSEEVTEEDAAIVSLGQILHIDNSLNEILDLKEGTSAHRRYKDEKWIMMK
ncbi:MAG: hypothetical protein MJ204_03840 [Bacteroidales bacterium]|nr:hypothetical protein [Bacteroidales bacterium]